MGARRERADAVRCDRVVVKYGQSGHAYLVYLHKRPLLHGLSEERRCSGRRGRRFKSCHPDAAFGALCSRLCRAPVLRCFYRGPSGTPAGAQFRKPQSSKRCNPDEGVAHPLASGKGSVPRPRSGQTGSRPSHCTLSRPCTPRFPERSMVTMSRHVLHVNYVDVLHMGGHRPLDAAYRRQRAGTLGAGDAHRDGLPPPARPGQPRTRCAPRSPSWTVILPPHSDRVHRPESHRYAASPG